MFLIKRAGPEDMQQIHDLAHSIWPQSYAHILSPEQLNFMLEWMYSLTSLENQMLQLHHQFALLYDHSVPIGFASYSLKNDDNKTCVLHKIYISNGYQGKGAGKMLVNYIINEARSLKAEKLELNVNRNNKAKSFYEKLDFRIVKMVDNHIGKGFYMNDYIMIKAL